MSDHEHERPNYCTCRMDGLEPDEKCPKHGFDWLPQCMACGQFMKQEVRDE